MATARPNFIEQLGQTLALVEQLRGRATGAPKSSPLPQTDGTPTPAAGGGGPLPPGWGTGGGGSGNTYDPTQPPGGKNTPPGFNPSTFGKNPTQPAPGWSVGRDGSLIPPGTDPTASGADSIQMGDLFQSGNTVYRWDGKSINKATAAEARSFLNGGSGSGTDPETIRHNRIGEAQQAIQNIIDRTQATATNTLSALPYVVGDAKYFPQYTPTSPLVRSGLADALPVTPIAFDPARTERMAGDPAQISADLARLRSIAGVG